MIKSNLQLRSISAPISSDPELIMLEEYLGGILSILLGSPIKQICIAPAQERAPKKSILLHFTGSLTVEIQIHSFSMRDMFKGVFALAQHAVTHPDLLLEEIAPGFLREPILTKSIYVQTLNGTSHLTICCDTKSLQGLPKDSTNISSLESKVEDSEIEMTIYGLRNADSMEIKQLTAKSPMGVLLNGELNEFGDFIIKEVVMIEDQFDNEIKAEIKLGSIAIKLKDLLELKPGSLIEIDWSKDAYGVLCVGGKEWTKVQLNISNGLLLLNIPADATFLPQ
jgi:hypothetical protein